MKELYFLKQKRVVLFYNFANLFSVWINRRQLDSHICCWKREGYFNSLFRSWWILSLDTTLKFNKCSFIKVSCSVEFKIQSKNFSYSVTMSKFIGLFCTLNGFYPRRIL